MGGLHIALVVSHIIRLWVSSLFLLVGGFQQWRQQNRRSDARQKCLVVVCCLEPP